MCTSRKATVSYCHDTDGSPHMNTDMLQGLFTVGPFWQQKQWFNGNVDK